MPFPPSDRIVFHQNPLDEVICQLRFPAPIMLQNELVEELHQLCREFLPVKERGTSQTSQTEGTMVSFRMSPTSHFWSEDRTRSLTLTSDFIAFTDQNYRDWDGFLGSFVDLFKKALELWEIPHIQRVGLRYVDVIRPWQLSDETKEGELWSKWVKPSMAGLWADREIGSYVHSTQTQTMLELRDYPGRVLMRYGSGVDGETQNHVYIIDSDFFSGGEISFPEALERLAEYRRRAGHLFRWVISDELQNLLRRKNP